ncbi:hypothetical protein yc1106_00545 [Curvularia clavata]|uniref:C-CAP/cofactor C-like domain-containing protein n=1 Tax=Curvularia clavata TaxID=95742 RepID=A0A9Q8YZR6_CURCL|nr:hypothetical protein yc1106_00545 [Curvularia clavata]
MSEANLKETFYRKFQEDVASIQTQISSLPETPAASRERNEAIEQCLAGIDRLSHDVLDASSFLPAYDQRAYSEAIKGLSEKLQNIRNSFDPPKKFSFKNKRKEAAAPVTTAPSVARETPAPSSAPSRADDIPSTTSSELSHKSSLQITLPSTPYVTSSPTVSHLTRCVVDLSPPTASGTPFATLYLRNIKDSLIICGRVAGAIHITDVSNSVIVTVCRQFRMHGSKRVDIYLHSASRPIIEDCEALRFAPLPETFIASDTSQAANQWDQIDDFKWLKSEPSPHFSILPEVERISDDVWRNVVPQIKEKSLEDILGAVNVR